MRGALRPVAEVELPPAELPTYNELERAKRAADGLLTGIRMAERFGVERVTLERELAEELHALLRDSLRAAERLAKQQR